MAPQATSASSTRSTGRGIGIRTAADGSERSRGQVHVYDGEGKGKSQAALGVVLRTIGLDPSQAEGQPTQPGRQEAVDEPEPPWRDRLEVHNLVASWPATFPWSRGAAALQPLGSHQ